MPAKAALRWFSSSRSGLGPRHDQAGVRLYWLEVGPRGRRGRITSLPTVPCPAVLRGKKAGSQTSVRVGSLRARKPSTLEWSSAGVWPGSSNGQSITTFQSSPDALSGRQSEQLADVRVEQVAQRPPAASNRTYGVQEHLSLIGTPQRLQCCSWCSPTYPVSRVVVDLLLRARPRCRRRRPGSIDGLAPRRSVRQDLLTCAPPWGEASPARSAPAAPQHQRLGVDAVVQRHQPLRSSGSSAARGTSLEQADRRPSSAGRRCRTAGRRRAPGCRPAAISSFDVDLARLS